MYEDPALESIQTPQQQQQHRRHRRIVAILPRRLRPCLSLAINSGTGVPCACGATTTTTTISMSKISNSKKTHSNNNTTQTHCMWLLLLLLLLGATAEEEDGTTPTTRTTILAMGLPRSGSDAIHSFFQCMGFSNAHHYCCNDDGSFNWNEYNNNNDKTKNRRRRRRQQRQQQQQPPSKPTTSNNNNKQTNGMHFPCPDHQIPCGTCVHANLMRHRPAFQGCADDDNSRGEKEDTATTTAIRTTTSTSTTIFSSFDVETSEPFSWFLPQHSALPLLLQKKSSLSFSSSTTTNHTHPTTTANEPEDRVVWILNERQTPTQWATNVLHWHSVTQRLLKSLRIPYRTEEDDNDDNEKKKKTNNNTDAMISSFASLEESATQKILVASSLNNNGGWYADLERSYHRAQSGTAHARRHAALVQTYTNHSIAIRDFVQRLQQHQLQQQQSQSSSIRYEIPRLVHLSVDDENAGHVLAMAMGLDPERAKTCWTFDAEKLDNDWMDFTLRL